LHPTVQINSLNCLSENLEPKLGPKGCIKKVGQSHVANDARGNVDKGRSPDYWSYLPPKTAFRF
jgi:hypothetical protein